MLAARRLAQIIRQILNELEKGPKIPILSDGQDFLRQAKEGQIVFLDVDMPQMDGIEVGRRLRERGLECPIIIETGFVDRFKEAFEIGAFRYATKEYDAGEIRRALEAVFEEEPGSEKMEWFDNRVKLEIRMRDIDVVRAYNSYVLSEVKEKVFRKEISLAQLGYMPQQQSMYPNYTVEEFIAYMGALHGMKREETLRKMNELLELLELEEKRKAKIRTLSGGMKQRFLLLQALLNSPKILILDEPTAGLDPGRWGWLLSGRQGLRR